MANNLTKAIFLTVCLLLGWSAHAQTNVSGQVTDAANGEGLIGANVLVKGTVLGTITDVQGNFSLSVSDSPPFTLLISSIGFTSQEIEITDSNISGLSIQLEEESTILEGVVVRDTRVPDNILTSPISVERMGILDIQNAPSPDFYDGIKNLNGVDFSTQSLTFKSVNARGFGANGNTRFVQLIDGIDNQAPGLNFPVGNVVGISELDLESVVLLPGASSALYGPNAIQGILLLESKSPFDRQGLDVSVKVGANHVDEEDDGFALYQDYGFRYAEAINDKFAFKVTGSFLTAQDFRGVDYRDQGSDIVERSPEIDPLNRADIRTYDGVNVYGDFLFNIGQFPGLDPSLASVASLLPTGSEGDFTPTGFRERDFVDNTTESLKLGAALHYKLTDDVEVLGQFNIGYGSSVYTANDRFILDDFSIWTGKLEVRGDNFFARGYVTQENSGDSYAANTLASLVNQTYYLGDYAGGFINARLAGADVETAHQQARSFADNAQQFGGNGHPAYVPGTPEFNRLSNDFRSRSIAEGGALFQDNSALYHYEGSYNFKNEIEWAEIIVGANFRTYALESEGTLFALDNAGEEISFSEFGGYVQVTKTLFEDLTLVGSMRYDKNENFDGQLSPRIGGSYQIASGRNQHNFRAAYSRGFRIPTTQDQYIDLDVVTRRLIGRNEILADRYNLNENPVYTTSSVQLAQQTGDPADLELADLVYEEYRTEKVGTWEVGYKALLLDGALFVDAFYYESVYTDLGAEVDITQAVQAGGTIEDIQSIPAALQGPGADDARNAAFIAGGDPLNDIALQRYGYDVNIQEDVKSRGWGLAAEYEIGSGYVLGGNVSFNELLDLDDLVAQEFNVAFNTPEWRYNVTLGNRKLTDRLGFNFAYRWQDGYLWQSAIGSGVIPDFGVFDAQFTYNLPSLKARLKVGGSNILNERYTTSFANPRIGALYYIQLNFDDILNR